MYNRFSPCRIAPPRRMYRACPGGGERIVWPRDKGASYSVNCAKARGAVRFYSIAKRLVPRASTFGPGAETHPAFFIPARPR